MTKELLEQYPDICAELADLERVARTPVSDVVSGSSGEYPYTQHAVRVEGLPPEQHRELIERLRGQKAEIEQFVFALKDAKMLRVAKLRALQGLSWKDVAANMGHKYSESGVKKIYSKIFL